MSLILHGQTALPVSRRAGHLVREGSSYIRYPAVGQQGSGRAKLSGIRGFLAEWAAVAHDMLNTARAKSPQLYESQSVT